MNVRKVFHVQATADASPSPGQLIRAARDRAGLSQERLARDADVSLSMIRRLERAKTAEQLPNTLALARIAARLGVPLADLLPADLQVSVAAAVAVT